MYRPFLILTVMFCILSGCMPPVSDPPYPAGSMVRFELAIHWDNAPVQNPVVEVKLYPKTGKTLTLINEARDSGCTVSKSVPAGDWMCSVQLLDGNNIVIAGYLEYITLENDLTKQVDFIDFSDDNRINVLITEDTMPDDIYCYMEPPAFEIRAGDIPLLVCGADCPINTVFVWRVDGVTVAVGNEIHYSFAEHGDKIVEVKSYSADGLRRGSCTQTLHIHAREVPIVTGPGITSEQRPTWTWSEVPGAKMYRHSFNQIDWYETEKNEYTPQAKLADDSHTLYVQAGDGEGNWSGSGFWTITIDSIPPFPPSQPDLLQDDDSGISNTDNKTNRISGLTLEGTAEENAVVKLYDNGSYLSTATTASLFEDGEWKWRTDIVLALSEGVHSITATAGDAAGHISSPSSPLMITIDTTPPAPPSISPGEGDYFTALSLSIGGIQYNPQYSLNNGADWNSGTSASLQVGYRYRVRARHADDAGNFSEAGPVVVDIWTGFCPEDYYDNVQGTSASGYYNCSVHRAEVSGSNGTCDLHFEMTGGDHFRACFEYFIGGYGGGIFKYPGGSISIQSTTHYNTCVTWSGVNCMLSGGGGPGAALLENLYFYRCSTY